MPSDQRSAFSHGLPKYYSHVLALFEKVEAYAYVVDFARLGLRCLKGNEDKDLRKELLSRLFNASIRIESFEDAYAAMVRLDGAL